MLRWSKKFNLVWPLLLGIVGFVLASMEVLESPNSLDGGNHPEEPVTEGEFPSTTSELLGTEAITEPITDDLSATTISGDPLNITESSMNLTETTAVGNEPELGGVSDATMDSVTGLTEIIEANNTESFASNDSSTNDETVDALKSEKNSTEWSPASVQNGPIPTSIQFAPASKNLSISASQYNSIDLLFKTLDPEDTDRLSTFNGSIPHQFVNYAPILPLIQSDNDKNSSNGQNMPRITPISLDSPIPLAVAYALPVKSPDQLVNYSNLRIQPRLLSLPVVVPPINSTLPASTDHQEGLDVLLDSSTELFKREWLRLSPAINPYAYGGPNLRNQDFEPRKGHNFIPIALPKSTAATTKPTKTTTKKSGFRSKTVLKKPKAKPTRKPKVRKVVEKILKTTKGKPGAGFRSGRKVRTVVKRRFRKVVRRATTTRLVFRRRRRTTRLVRKTTTPRLMTTAGEIGNPQN